MEIPAKGPEHISVFSYLVVLVLSILGGFVRYLREASKESETKKMTFKVFLFEILSSILTGLVVFFLCEASHFDRTLSAALVAVAGHTGSQLLFRLEAGVNSVLNRVISQDKV